MSGEKLEIFDGEKYKILRHTSRILLIESFYANRYKTPGDVTILENVYCHARYTLKLVNSKLNICITLDCSVISRENLSQLIVKYLAVSFHNLV